MRKEIKDKALEVILDKASVTSRLTNDRMGRFVAKEWHRLITPYTPRKTGQLIRTVEYLPFAIYYKQPYAHYMYEGKVYVDPETGASGFLTDKGWRSRRNVRKIPSARTFAYSKKGSPFATDHWDVVAAKSGQKDKLYQIINKALDEGKF